MADPFGVLAPRQGASDARGRDALGLTSASLVRSPRIEDFPEVVDPVVEEAQVGSPLNTLYGVDSESFLTDDQRKLARMIQGRFDASANRRDRELARYGAPMLSSFTEDEALARAMASARGLNYRPPEEAAADPFGFARGKPVPAGVQPGRTLTPTTKETEETGAQQNAKWQRILSGLASIIPLLFGKDAFGNFLNKGALQWGKELLFGKDANLVSDKAFENLVQSGGTDTGLMGGVRLPNFGGGGGGDILTGLQNGDSSGIGSGWGLGDRSNGFGDTPGITGGTLQDYWNDPGMWDSGYWYPDLGGSLFDSGDPFGIGGW